MRFYSLYRTLSLSSEHFKLPQSPGAGRGWRGGRRLCCSLRRMFAGLVMLVLATLLLVTLLSRVKPYGLFDLRPRMERAPLLNLNQTFLVDTPGCRIPNLEARSPEVLEFVYDYGEVSCDDPPALVRSDDVAVYLVPEAAYKYGVDVRSLDCCFRPLWLKQANFTLPEVEGADNSRLANFTLPPGGSAKFGDVVEFGEHCTPFKVSARVPYEFVRVECSSEGSEVYRDFHGFVRLPASRSPTPPSSSAAAQMNVLLVGADNVSRLNLLRSMPRVAALLDRLGAITMRGYNKVDDYSYVNLVPLLAGMPSKELERRCLLPNSVFFDPCPWLWKVFGAHGYLTAFMEDTPSLGLFHFYSPGFARQPTDVDPRPLLLAAERQLPRSKPHGTSPVCLGPRFQIQGLFDFAMKFIRAVVKSQSPFFQYVWGTSLTHDYLNQAQVADPVYERFLEDLESTGVLNSTVLVFMSDHGNRVGGIVSTYQGHVEDRLPVMSFVLPPWMEKRYPLAVSTMRSNTHRLVTVMDVHETVKHLTDLRSLEDARLEAAALDLRRQTLAGQPPRTISLFLPVPDSRTCEQAAVLPHFCACVHLTPVASDDRQVVAAAQLLVDTINAALEPHPLCARLQLHSVRSARRGEPTSLLGRRESADRVREQEFLVTVETQPGGALLEGTLRHLVAENVMKLAGRVTRLNKYGNTSWCAPDRALRLYCYCLEQPPGTT